MKNKVCANKDKPLYQSLDMFILAVLNKPLYSDEFVLEYLTCSLSSQNVISKFCLIECVY